MREIESVGEPVCSSACARLMPRANRQRNVVNDMLRARTPNVLEDPRNGLKRSTGHGMRIVPRLERPIPLS